MPHRGADFHWGGALFVEGHPEKAFWFLHCVIRHALASAGPNACLSEKYQTPAGRFGSTLSGADASHHGRAVELDDQEHGFDRGLAIH